MSRNCYGVALGPLTEITDSLRFLFPRGPLDPIAFLEYCTYKTSKYYFFDLDDKQIVHLNLWSENETKIFSPPRQFFFIQQLCNITPKPPSVYCFHMYSPDDLEQHTTER
jgi:hypothetical protein